ncbi:hypothetical protein ACHAWF_001610 [Thalassiosira exigua]
MTALDSTNVIVRTSLVIVPLLAVFLYHAVRYFVQTRVYPHRHGILKQHLSLALADKVCGERSRMDARKASRVLDFGAGMGHTSKLIKEVFGDADSQPDITAIDVYESDNWFGGEVSRRLVYTGGALPFLDGEFEVAFVGQVLHHVTDNALAMRELARVARDLVIIEDLVLPGTFQEQFFYLWDSLWNNDWFDSPPHTNRAHTDWMDLFANLQLETCHEHFTSIAFCADRLETSPEPVFQDCYLANGFYVLSHSEEGCNEPLC